MGSWRNLAGAGVVIALAVGLVAVNLGGRSSGAAPVVSFATSSSSSAAVDTTRATTTTTVATTSTTTLGQRMAEVESTLQHLWYGWLDAIYQKDADALWHVVATRHQYEAGVAAFQTLTFDDPPTLETTIVEVHEILLDREDCLAVYSTTTTDFGERKLVDVLWFDQGHWKLATAWGSPGDYWQLDCDLVVRDVLP